MLHGAGAVAEFGAEVGGEERDEEGEFAEERLHDREAAADDGEVDFDGPGLDVLVSEKVGQEEEEVWGGSLHPDFDLDDIPGRVREVGGGVQYVLPYDSDGRDSGIDQRVDWKDTSSEIKNEDECDELTRHRWQRRRKRQSSSRDSYAASKATASA